MLKRLRDWLFGPEVTDPNDPALDEYPDIIPDMDIEEIMRRMGVTTFPTSEDDTHNFDIGGEG